jgi:type II secretory pathway pseudopilin PulG
MYLGGQGGQRGYAMAALLVSVGVLAVVMTALLPVWRQQAQREKEAELAFRGEQYARAIYLFNRKNGGMNPPAIDVLVQGNYLRKKYKDPMTEDGEFQPLFVGANQPGQPGPQGGPGRGGPASVPGRGPSGQPLAPGGGAPGTVQGGAGILGVISKSKEPSIRIYYGASHYNEWQFRYNRQGRGAPGQVGGPGGGPMRGQPGIGAPGRGGPRGGPGGLQGPGRGGGPGRDGGPGRGRANVPGPGRRGFPGGRGQ